VAPCWGIIDWSGNCQRSTQDQPTIRPRDPYNLQPQNYIRYQTPAIEHEHSHCPHCRSQLFAWLHYHPHCIHRLSLNCRNGSSSLSNPHHLAFCGPTWVHLPNSVRSPTTAHIPAYTKLSYHMVIGIGKQDYLFYSTPMRSSIKPIPH
jgi:hypothetical protein